MMGNKNNVIYFSEDNLYFIDGKLHTADEIVLLVRKAKGEYQHEEKEEVNTPDSLESLYSDLKGLMYYYDDDHCKRNTIEECLMIIAMTVLDRKNEE